jgi:carboxyl-terminal processing protease
MIASSKPENRARWSAVAGVLFVLVATNPLLWADPTTPNAEDHNIALTVSGLLAHDHLTTHPLDDEISQRCMKTFLKTLDPLKVYFYQSDIDRFEQHQNELDDAILKGDVSFAYEVFKTFLARLDERMVLVDEFLAAEHDFTIDEEMVRDKDVAQFARNEGEAREIWRKRIKYDLLLLKADKKVREEEKAAKAAKAAAGEPIPADEAEDNKADEDPIEKLAKRYRNIARRWHQTDGDELLELYLSSLTMSFDPHTTYMSASTNENFLIQMRLELEGIGAALQSIDGYTVVQRIIPGGAADKDGRLKVEDKIHGVGQGPEGEIEDVVDIKLGDVVKRIRGKKGTVVRLEVTAGDSPEKRVIDIVRAKIELSDEDAQAKVFDEGHKLDGSPYKVGVIKLPSFYMDMAGARMDVVDYKSTTRDVRKILEDFNQQGVDAVILDLRRNGGGSLQEAISLTGLFIDGPVVQVKGTDQRVYPYYDQDGGIVWKGPLVVYIDKFSASASEILAGAIQDYGRGLIIGDHSTHGKGTVQSLLDLGQALFQGMRNSPSMGALKITIQQFYRPNGESTQNRGVLADIELPSWSTHSDMGEADLDYPIPFDRVKPLDTPKAGLVDPAVCNRLRQLSEQRRAKSEDFQKVGKYIELYLQQKDRKYVTLNEAKFMKELEELNAFKQENESADELLNANDSKIDRDFYLDEALAITIDYLQMVLLAQGR